MIPLVSPITVRPRDLNARLWLLIAKEQDGSISIGERLELDAMFRVIDAEQDPSND